MTPTLALFFAMLTAQVTPPATQPASDPSPAQTTPSESPTSPSPAALPTPDTTAVRSIGGGVTPPHVLYRTEPAFTKEARKQKVSGVARVNLIVDAEGRPTNVHIVRSVADSLDEKHRDQKHIAAALTLDQKAVDAVRLYRFAPAMFHGKPVPVELNVEVNFQIY